jgi:hypothetical protein
VRARIKTRRQKNGYGKQNVQTARVFLPCA